MQSSNSPSPSPSQQLREKATKAGLSLTGAEFAALLDKEDPLGPFREKFHYPKKGYLPEADADLIDPDEDCIFMCGNSLGLQPKSTMDAIRRVCEQHARIASASYAGWHLYEDDVQEPLARLVGAKVDETSAMGSCNANLHTFMIPFYQPTQERHKILIESGAFPSDHYAVESQIQLHGYDPKTSLICIEPREEEYCLHMDDILGTIEREGESIALIMFPGIQYYTGQLFDMEAITKAGHAKGCYVGLDLAHAVGNVELSLHDWGVDFAVWCNYKYVGDGVGRVGAAFLHERHADDTQRPRMVGWWGQQLKTRFDMDNVTNLTPGVAGYRVTMNPPIQTATLQASLDIFAQTSLKELRSKSKLLTGYLEMLLLHLFDELDADDDGDKKRPKIITPSDPEWRGAQLSVFFPGRAPHLLVEMKKRGVLMDRREPDVLRMAPCPLYNSFDDVYRLVACMRESLHTKTTTLSAKAMFIS